MQALGSMNITPIDSKDFGLQPVSLMSEPLRLQRPVFAADVRCNLHMSRWCLVLGLVATDEDSFSWVFCSARLVLESIGRKGVTFVIEVI